MRIVIVPSGFKECMDAEEVALAMERGAKRFDRAADVEIVPMIDGGEGFAKTIIRLKAGKIIYREVTEPVGEKILSHFGIFDRGWKKDSCHRNGSGCGFEVSTAPSKESFKDNDLWRRRTDSFRTGFRRRPNLDRLRRFRHIRRWSRNGTSTRRTIFQIHT